MLLLLACAVGVPSIEAQKEGRRDTDTGPSDLPGDTAVTTTTEPPTWAGDGADGPLTVTTDLELGSVGGAVFRVSALDGDTVTVDHDVSGLAVGDEVLFYVAQGTRDENEDVGTWHLSTVAAVAGAEVQLTEAPPLRALGAQSAVLQRVPHFTDVTVDATLAPPAWDGLAGGVLAFRATGAVQVGATGSLRADGKGYAGGDTGSEYNRDGKQGTSWSGVGLGDGGGNQGYNEQNGAWAANGGGGGAMVSGGGGNHAGGATAGTPWASGATAPEAGATYGEPELAHLFFGSGGGGIWNGDGEPGPGGNGGGIVFVAARSIGVAAAAGVSARGDTATAWSDGNWTYGAGGGAGGTIWLIADTLALVDGAIDSTGGRGRHDVERPGGDGGEGRIRIDALTLEGATMHDACTPDAGFTGVPGQAAE